MTTRTTRPIGRPGGSSGPRDPLGRGIPAPRPRGSITSAEGVAHGVAHARPGVAHAMPTLGQTCPDLRCPRCPRCPRRVSRFRAYELPTLAPIAEPGRGPEPAEGRELAGRPTRTRRPPWELADPTRGQRSPESRARPGRGPVDRPTGQPPDNEGNAQRECNDLYGANPATIRSGTHDH